MLTPKVGFIVFGVHKDGLMDPMGAPFIDDSLIAAAKSALRSAGLELVEYPVILATKAGGPRTASVTSRSKTMWTDWCSSQAPGFGPATWPARYATMPAQARALCFGRTRALKAGVP